MATKLIGGTDSQHFKPEKHPFQSSFTCHRAFARTTGIGPNPGGEGHQESANSAMKKKRPLTGPGKA